MEQRTQEPAWLTTWRNEARSAAEHLPESVTYEGGIKGVFSHTPSFDGEAPTYRVVSIEKELELYTLKEAYETLGINDLLKGLLGSSLVPLPLIQAEAMARAKIVSGLFCYVQPKIDEVGTFVEQKISLETTLGAKSAADILVVIAKTGARVVIEHSFAGASDSSTLWRTCIVVCEEGAEVRFIDEVDQVSGAIAVDRFGLIGDRAKVDWIENISAPILYRSHMTNMLAGADASAKVEHVLLAQAEAQYDISAQSLLRAEGTRSNIVAIGAVYQRGHIIYQSNSDTGNAAAHAKGEEHAKFLLLDDAARVDVVPLLTVGNSSAQAEHRVVVTHVRDEEMFYASAKGLGVENARLLALEGFFAEAKHSDRLRAKLISLA
ncbi:MAG TPA: SufD family Fe-S cluster assembly protein [Candidatus Paceibacterota bacterium]|nr:SufD family Fe-S cluster assembly protein [Candidatus Paceibacterota bacterium]